ncbi:MAG: sugar transferase [Bacteroidetes bacterium]|nr:sugar transferase [Bacteroidota bacterium]
MKNNFLQTLKYVFFDALAAALAWGFFYYYRSVHVEGSPFVFNHILTNGLIIITSGWLLMYFILGTYKNTYRKSRLKELGQTLSVSIFGVTVIFFAILIDDFILTYKQYYSSYLALLGFHFGITAVFRFFLSSITAYRVHNRLIGFNTLIIGSNEKAVRLYQDLSNEIKSSGHNVIGFLNVEEKNEYLLSEKTPHLGHFQEAKSFIEKHQIEDVIIAIETSEHGKISGILSALENEDVFIKIIPDMYDILSGSVKMNSILGTPLIEVNHDLLPEWERWTKTAFDYLVGSVSIILFSPIYLFTALMVKLSSPGPILYKQERIGLHGKPFYIYKFRSMKVDAEKDGPQLSSKTDSRITSWGRFMRKTRLDETPQFFNILKGDMSFVGPRPERQFYAEQMIVKAPHYKHLYKVKPGITSWGMVKFGYAENLEEMLERLRYDVLYIENMSILIDFKIMIHTVLIIFQGRGK